MIPLEALSKLKSALSYRSANPKPNAWMPNEARRSPTWAPPRMVSLKMDNDKQTLYDARLASHTVGMLRTLAARPAAEQQAAPFFMMVGFKSPHQPWVVP